jgi:hypothetical protein
LIVTTFPDWVTVILSPAPGARDAVPVAFAVGVEVWVVPDEPKQPLSALTITTIAITLIRIVFFCMINPPITHIMNL